MENPIEEDLYTIEWTDIENAEMDYENYLNDIENFFRKDFEEPLNPNDNANQQSKPTEIS